MTCGFPDLAPTTSYWKGCRCSRCRGGVMERRRTHLRARAHERVFDDGVVLLSDTQIREWARRRVALMTGRERLEVRIALAELDIDHSTFAHRKRPPVD